MRISSITLNNYRLYYGANTISFPEEEGKNIYLICGENGYGKTTFLHSLLWCLYGKAMTEVDDSIKKEINARGGYNIHLETNLNNKARKEIEGYTAKDIVSLRKSLNLLTGKNPLDNAKYSISIEFEDVFVPSIQCKSIIVTRQYDTLQKIEDVQIFIDGKTNEFRFGAIAVPSSGANESTTKPSEKKSGGSTAESTGLTRFDVGGS